LAEALGLPYHELDGVFHQPGWTRLPPGEFERRVASLVDGPAWVIDGNYSEVRPSVWSRADTVVYLDVSMARMLWRLVPRTIRRSWRHTELWNGNKESWSNMISLNREVNIILWATSNFGRYRQTYRRAMTDPQWAEVSFVRLCSSTQVEIFLKHIKEGVV
jgi:adenylate kinase family enzyme